MFLGIYYIAARNSALNRFTDLNGNDLLILDLLCKENKPLHYTRLYALLRSECYTIQYKAFTEILRRNIAARYITRDQVAGNVVYAITVEGKRLLYQFNQELDRIVSDNVRIYGNGLSV